MAGQIEPDRANENRNGEATPVAIGAFVVGASWGRPTSLDGGIVAHGSIASVAKRHVSTMDRQPAIGRVIDLILVKASRQIRVDWSSRCKGNDGFDNDGVVPVSVMPESDRSHGGQPTPLHPPQVWPR